ncbi:hypothetical protein RHGRI_024470 [Rhododendron griersonianum]|uniref:Uncharacterized protein n=1 Tax=Rhododendron griersonianum TaxID=479676 RepID=A0AAV6JCI2_9ERIC|nr:hypothetical protein RHGRI_024470 [Rhododendron griersonianum]
MLGIASADLRKILGMRSRKRAPVRFIIWHTRRVMRLLSTYRGSVGMLSNMIELDAETENGITTIGVNDRPPGSTGEGTTVKRFTIDAKLGLQIFQW